MASILREFISSGIPIIWVYSIEEDRLLNEESSILLSKRMRNKVYVYDATNQIADIERKDNQVIEIDSPVDAVQLFTKNSNYKFEEFVIDGQSTWDINEHGFPQKSVMIMLDAPFYMTDPSKVKHTNARLTRCIKNSMPSLIQQGKSIVFVNHHPDIPIELEHIVTYVEHKLPDVKKMKSIAKGSQTSIVGENIPQMSLTEDELDVIAQQLTGLTQLQAENVLSLANRENILDYLKKPEQSNRTFKNEVIRREKSRLIQKSGVLQIVDCSWGMDQVGGMENLKDWAKDRSLIFKHEAREDGIDLPKGLCVVGPGGTGKSWVAQALGKEWDRTVLRLDIGACMGSLLGESEGKLIKALKDAEAQSPCILFIDEFEKLFAGANGSVTDGGTFQRMYGTWLTWTQSKKSDVFVVATTNNIQNIPAPALRKGRFDEVMYVGLPGLSQREEIFSIHLKKRGWDPSEYKLDITTLAQKTPHRTGSEIEQIVIEGLIRKGKELGFGKKFPIQSKHLVAAIDDVKIMAELNPEEAKSLYDWAKSHKVMMANKDDDSAPKPKSTPILNVSGKIETGRKISIDESEI